MDSGVATGDMAAVEPDSQDGAETRGAPEAVIVGCNAETSEEVVKDTGQGCFPGELALLHLVLQEGAKVSGKADELAGHNEPFCGDALVPPDGIAVVHGELVVEVLVALTEDVSRPG